MAISELKLPQGVTAHEFRTPACWPKAWPLTWPNDCAAISARGEATLVVSGGRSPVAFFQHLAKQAWTGRRSPSAWLTSAGYRWSMPTAMPAC
jgi:6-phosphogluconolactonase